MREIGCMGGWCAKRDRCCYYHSNAAPSLFERLCRPGKDGASDVVRTGLEPRSKPAPILASAVATEGNE